ncbi:MAG: hypothetical protein AAFX06_26280 [Planctomycetota bacterium]
MYVEPIYVLIALLPLIAHLFQLSVIRVCGRVLITTGGRDIAALGFAVAGFVAIGPGELFFPKAAAGLFGPWVWIALFTLYALIITLIALSAKPKLVAYGRTPEQLFEPLFSAAKKLDGAATADREVLQVHLPTLRVHLRLSGHRWMDHASIESFENIPSVTFWNGLLGHLREEAESTKAVSPRRGISMLVIAIALLGVVIWQGYGYNEQLVEGFREWLWR